MEDSRATNSSQSVSPSQQNPLIAHPIPILQLSKDYILAGIPGSEHTSALSSFYQSKTTNPTKRAERRIRSLPKLATSSDPANPIQCGVANPCKDGSCCNKSGNCGFRESNCGASCISNCNAQAMCGVNSPGGSKKCGLNICCSYYGFCGVCFFKKYSASHRADFYLGR